jgi:hypothetical protein
LDHVPFDLVIRRLLYVNEVANHDRVWWLHGEASLAEVGVIINARASLEVLHHSQGVVEVVQISEGWWARGNDFYEGQTIDFECSKHGLQQLSGVEGSPSSDERCPRGRNHEGNVE